MELFAGKCPVGAQEQGWIQDSMSWLATTFEADDLSRAVVLPTAEYFPPPYDGSDADMRAAVHKVAKYMGVQAPRLTVTFSDELKDINERNRALPVAGGHRGAAGVYEQHKGKNVITLDRSNATKPARLLAVIAHELAHVRLLGERKIPASRKDGEPLTDLTTIFLGMGIFTANAAFEFTRYSGASTSGWSTSKLGYLTERMFGYGLACHAWLREEPRPAWAKYLDTNPRAYLKHGLRYLARSAEPGQFPAPSDEAAILPT